MANIQQDNIESEKISRKKSEIYWRLLKFSIIPIIILSICIMIFIFKNVTNIIYDGTEESLKNMAYMYASYLDKSHPGDYRIFDHDGELIVFKGEAVLNDDFTYIDEVRQKSDIYLSLVLRDVKILTSITNDEGERLTGKMVNSVIVREVQVEKCEHFYPRAVIGKKTYSAYYVPIYNADGTCMGMIGVAKPVSELVGVMLKTIVPIVFITLIIGAFALIGGFRYTGKLTRDIIEIQNFMGEVANGELDTKIGYEVMRRGDEIQAIAQSAVAMQSSLRRLIELDALTELNNRRFAEKQFYLQCAKSKATGQKISVAIADVDKFKKINDTYGHEAGDAILKKVAFVLRKNMLGKGFAARWGGEEFMLCFYDTELDMAGGYCDEIRKEIEEQVTYYQGEQLMCHMSFGVADTTEADAEALIRLADARLYYAKEHGRNQVVKEIPQN